MRTSVCVIYADTARTCICCTSNATSQGEIIDQPVHEPVAAPATETAPLRVAIFGSCATRDNFNSRFNPDYRRWFEVGASANQSSVIALMSPPVETPFAPVREMSAYNLWNIGSDLRREFLADLETARPDVLILDFFADVHFGVARLPDGRFLTDNRWKTHHTDLYARHRDAGELTLIKPLQDPEAYFALWTEAIDRFAERLDSTCPGTRIVVHRGYNTAELAVPDKARPVSLRRNTKIARLNVPVANAFWSRLDDYAITSFGWDSIDLRILKAPTYAEHPWGPFYVHYTPDYYHRFIAELHKMVLPDVVAPGVMDRVATIEAAAVEPLERQLAVERATVDAQRAALQQAQARLQELENFGAARALRFAVGQRIRARRAQKRSASADS